MNVVVLFTETSTAAGAGVSADGCSGVRREFDDKTLRCDLFSKLLCFPSVTNESWMFLVLRLERFKKAFFLVDDLPTALLDICC